MNPKQPENKAKSGRFQKGVSGNPGGRPKLPQAFKEHNEEAVAKIVKLMRSRNEKIAFQAAQLIVAYNLGKPTEHHQLSGQLSLGQLLDSSWDENGVHA